MLRTKSGLVGPNYSDESEAKIATKAPTLQRISKLAIICLAASLHDKKIFSRDVKDAYLRSTKPLERQVYIKAPLEKGLPPDTVHLVLKPIYGIQ